MNIVSAFCLSLFVATVLAAESPKFCVRDSKKCENAKSQGLKVTCYEMPKGGSCISEVVEGKADLALAYANDLVKYVDKVNIVLGENYGVFKDDAFVKYYGVAVVKKNKTFPFEKLKGKKSCHTGAGRTAGWKIPVGYLLSTKKMPYIDNQWKSVAEFFNGSCAPGIADKTEDKEVREKLCMQCNDTCSASDGYSSYSGAFHCMNDGRGDVAFIKQSTTEDTIGKAAVSGYRLLCPNNEFKEVKDYASCNIGKRPSGAIVTGTNKNKTTIEAYRRIFQGVNVTMLGVNGIISTGVKYLNKTDSKTKDYVGKYYDYVRALTQSDETTTSAPDSGSSSAAGFFVVHVFGFLSYFYMF